MEIKEDLKVSLLLEDLSSLEEYIDSLFNFFPLPICFVSPLGIILEENSVFEKMANFSLGEAIGEQIEKLFKKEEIEKVIKETLKQGFVEGRELEFYPKDKKPLPVQIFTKTRKDKGKRTIGFFLSLFDLTEIKETESELKKSQSALLNILEDTEEARKNAEIEKNKTLTVINNFADGLLVFDRENRLSLINPQATVFFDLRTRDLVGRSALELSSFSNIASLMKLLGIGIKGIFRQELSVRENLTLEVSTIPIMSEEEKLGTLVILHDITRERMIEQMKTEFVSLAAHQLRTPLSAIKWTLKMLLDEDLGEITEEQREFIEKTYQSNEGMIGLINDLLDITRIEEGRYLYKPVLVNFEDIVHFVFNSYQEEIARKKIVLDFKKPRTKLPRVSIDVEKIRLVVQNLLDNAIKYTSPEGKITASLRYNKEKKEIFFSIKDTGIGIPQDQQIRVFTKFFRGANVMRMDTKGTGLGLFISKNIIQAHGGKIWFESEEGKGTTFYFSLPVREEFTEFLKEF